MDKFNEAIGTKPQSGFARLGDGHRLGSRAGGQRYQLAFWTADAPLKPRKVFLKLCSGKRILGLAPLDAQEAERRLRSAFPDWTVDASLADARSQTMLTDGRAALDVFYAPGGVVCTCYGMSPEELNSVIDAMNALGMPLYDPQTDERFGI